MSAYGGPRLSTGVAFWAAASALLLIVGAAGMPAALYPVYQDTYGISATGITTSFGAYIFGVAICLLVFGRVSDFLGRRSMTLVAIAAAVIGCVLMATVDSSWHLALGRLMQGIAVGFGTSSITTYGFELAPARRPWLAPAVFGSGTAAGIAFGAFIGGVFVQYLPRPFSLIFEVEIGLLVVIAILVLLAPETRPRQAGLLGSLRPQVAVPRSIRRVFVVCALCVTSAWTIGALFQSLGPSMAAQLFDNHNRLFGGLIVSVLVGVSVVASVASGRFRPTGVFALGAVSLGAGLALSAIAVGTAQLGLLFGAVAVAGVGFGATFLGAFKYLTAKVAPADRAGVLSTAYMVLYVGSSTPAVLAGPLVQRIGLLGVTFTYLGYVAVLLTVASIAFTQLVRSE